MLRVATLPVVSPRGRLRGDGGATHALERARQASVLELQLPNLHARSLSVVHYGGKQVFELAQRRTFQPELSSDGAQIRIDVVAT